MKLDPDELLARLAELEPYGDALRIPTDGSERAHVQRYNTIFDYRADIAKVYGYTPLELLCFEAQAQMQGKLR